MRLFVAADLPESIQGALADNLCDLAKVPLEGRLANPQNLHVTLAFLGDQKQEDLERVQRALLSATEKLQAFDVALGDYGTFGNAPGKQILWQGFQDDDDLQDLAQAVREALDKAGIGFDEKSFAAHITLARKAKADVESLEEPWVDEGRISSVTLYRSQLGADGPTYTALATYPLAKPWAHPQGRLLLIDADACPVTREALTQARAACVPVVLVGNGTQNLAKHLKNTDPRSPREGFWVATLNVKGGADSADFQIATMVQEGDVVVTQDFGVAAMALGAGAAALGVRGREYTREGIDALMLVRHEEKKLRRQGGRTQGPHAFTDEDRARFSRALQRLLEV